MHYKSLLQVCFKYVSKSISCMGWLQLVGSFKLSVSFAKEPYKRELYSAKETYNFKEPTNRSHPICPNAFRFLQDCRWIVFVGLFHVFRSLLQKSPTKETYIYIYIYLVFFMYISLFCRSLLTCLSNTSALSVDIYIYMYIYINICICTFYNTYTHMYLSHNSALFRGTNSDIYTYERTC